MRRITGRFRFLPLVMLLVLAGPAQAADLPRSGFFESYNKLQPINDSWITYLYTSEDFEEVLGETRIIVVPELEIVLAKDSKYRSISPSEMKTLADSFQSLIVDALSDKYQIARNPGANTIVIRMALSNVHLKKKGRGFLGYTPIGLVATPIKRAREALMEKILLTEVIWESEILDGQNGDVIAQLMTPMGNHSKKKQFASWDDLTNAMAVAGLRLRCRLDNAAEGGTRDCLQITAAHLPST